jgi:hypothetical protein
LPFGNILLLNKKDLVSSEQLQELKEAKVIAVDFENPPSSNGQEEDLEASLKRLRSLERSTAVAIQDLLAKGRACVCQLGCDQLAA